jgi:hypothetical protein
MYFSPNSRTQNNYVSDMENAMIVYAVFGIHALLIFGSTLSANATLDNPEQGLPKIERTIPAPLPDHPGNIYLEGESVSIRVGPDIPQSAASWILFDDAHNKIKNGLVLQSGVRVEAIAVGALPIGWYRMEFADAVGKPAGWTTAAVIKQLAAPTPLDSPVCIDTAMAWFARDNAAEQTRHANLAALAGANWVRDRITWKDMQPQRGKTTDARTTYDMAADIQSKAGLRVLQVFHYTADWAADTAMDGPDAGKHFPRDLRDMYNLGKAMAQRFRGKVHAWEPWNEANIEMFGGQTVDEMCSLQKAAYLGFKSGDPDVIVGWNVYTTLPTKEHTQGLADNDAYYYYDTYNIHTYEWHNDYYDLWGPARAAAGGKPLWVTEADRGIPFETPGPWYEQSQENEMHKARYIAQAYACSLSAGCTRHFQFILGNFAEEANHTQFGLLRKDFTPRTAYAAFAAVGRLLAGAKFVTIWNQPDQPNTKVYVFNARPDGKDRQVIVLWAEKPVDWKDRNKTATPWPLPMTMGIEQIYDYLGRRIGRPQQISGSAVFVVCSRPAVIGMPTQCFQPKAENQPACPIVLQVQMPRNQRVKISPIEWSQGFEYQIPAGQETPLVMYAYNFSDATIEGTVTLKNFSGGRKLEPKEWSLKIGPMDRQRFEAKVTIAPASEGKTATGTVQLLGDFGSAGESRLSFAIQGK